MGNNSVTGHFILNDYAQIFKAMVVSVEHRFYVRKEVKEVKKKTKSGF